MRKHFLILMLMALLPLAGWAQSQYGGDYVITPVTTTYGDAIADFTFGIIQVSGHDYTLTNAAPAEGNYTIDLTKVYSDEACTQVVSGAIEGGKITLPVDASKTYYLKVQAYGWSNFKGGAFKVTEKFELKVSVSDDLKMSFGAAVPTIPQISATVTKGWKYEVEPLFDDKPVVTVELDYDEDDIDELFNKLNAGLYDYKATTTADNYTVTVVKADAQENLPQFEVEKLSIADEAIIVGSTVGEAFYNRLVQKRNYNAITFQSKTLRENTDFTVKYYETLADCTNDQNAVGEVKDAKTYYARLFGAGNFNNSITDNTALYTWIIKPMPITVRALPNQTKVYDGNANFPIEGNNKAWEIIGNVGDELNGYVPSFLKTIDANEAADPNVGTGKTLAIGELKIPGDPATPFADPNYAPYYVNQNDAAITAIRLTINLENQTGVKNQGLKSEAQLQEALTITETGAEPGADLPDIVTTESDDIKAAINIDIDDDDLELGAVATKGGRFDLTLEKNTEVALLGNYIIALPETNPTYTITGGVVTITTLNKTRGYLDDEFDWNNAEMGQTKEYTVTGIEDATQVTGIVLSRAKLGEEGGDNAGQYAITATWVGKPDYYDVYVAEGIYTITPAPITITAVKPQTILIGDLLNQTSGTAYTVEGEKKNGEEWTDIIALSIKEGYKNAETGKASVAVDNLAEGIELSLKTTNYEFAAGSVTKGTLTILDPTNVLYLNNDNTLATRLAEAKTANYVGMVKFGPRKLVAEKWHTMVLPFDIAVEDIASNIGYSVVNILNDNSTYEKINFKFHMQGIPANTPFIIKPAYDIELGDISFSLASLKKVTDVNTVDRTTYGENKIKYDVAAAAANTFFKGTYADFLLEAPQPRYGFLYNGNWVRARNNSYTVSPFEAYLDYGPDATFANAPLITVEDENGTTAIMTVAMDGSLIEAEGWYTINGIKLQGVPTEKGIYIRNGKKIVVK